MQEYLPVRPDMNRQAAPVVVMRRAERGISSFRTGMHLLESL
jgi:hypothetical protein